MHTKANMSIINQDCPYAMNQTCKVCGEPAAGFHFGAFTCEGCKSFFGRSYNNLASISDCKNNGECIINKKNRTACKACRLRKCIMVGMSKSGSRYGRRSNWFKIHCLLQAQHQQQQQQHQQAQNAGAAHMVAAAAAAAAAAVNSNNSSTSSGQKQSAACSSTTSSTPSQGTTAAANTSGGNMGLVSPPTAAAAALGIFSHGAPYAGLYAPRTKEELMMLGLEVYKHAAPSPSVSSPDSHNSDNSGEGTVRSNTLLHMAGKHAEQAAASIAPQIRKELSPFLQLPFPNLTAMPVMPPPSFLPPSHMLFPGYHPALYQHHQHGALLRPIQPQQLRSKQQEQQTAAAVRHLISATATPNTQGQRFSAAELMSLSAEHNREIRDTSGSPMENSKDDTLNNNHLPNGSKMAEELTKCFYLDAMMKSQQQHGQHSPTKQSPPILHRREDSRNNGSLDNDNDEKQDEENEDLEEIAHDVDQDTEDVKESMQDNENRELIVSMTPPRSPSLKFNNNNNNNNNDTRKILEQQDNPIDLSIKICSSAVSSASSKCSRSSFVNDDSDNERESELQQGKRERISNFSISSKTLEVKEEADESAPNSKRIKLEESCSDHAQTIEPKNEDSLEKEKVKEEEKEESILNVLAEPPLDLTRKL